MCDLLAINTYVPHKYKKTSPCAADVLAQLHEFLSDSKKVKPDDCIVLMGDFSCELQRNVQGCTGRWFMNKRSDDGHSEQVMDLLRTHNLFAVDSLFRSRSKVIGQGAEIRPRVSNATYLQKDPTRRPKKLDYFFVSSRWKINVTNSATSWAPSVHRFGKYFDHCLLHISWKWRIKVTKSKPTKDFKAMTRDDWLRLDYEINDALHKCEEPTVTENTHIDASLTHMNVCINQAIEECVPCKKRLSVIKREPSEKTRDLYGARARKFSKIGIVDNREDDQRRSQQTNEVV